MSSWSRAVAPCISTTPPVPIPGSGRPGPVWIDIPLDVQAATVDADAMPSFDPAELGPAPTLSAAEVEAEADAITDLLAGATRPLVLVGAGVRLSGAESRVL